MNDPIEGLAPGFDLCRLDHCAAVRVVGTDAAAFLHGQLSNDVAHLHEGQAVAAAYCNPKGRVIATLRLVRTGPDEFMMLLARGLAEPVIRRLRLYVLRAKVAFEPVEWGLFALPDDDAAARLTGRRAEKGAAEGVRDALLVNVGVSRNRYWYLSPDGEAPGGAALDAPPDAWLSIQAIDGIAEVFGETSESFLPQAINLDLIGAVDFRKGCYPGQEIVARLRYLGKLKQRMLRLSIAAPPPAPGTGVLASGRKVGEIVLAGPSSRDGTSVGLASVTFAGLDREAVTLEDGTVLAVFEPGYDVPEFAEEASA